MLKLGVVMDPIQAINIKKDSTFAMLLEAQRRGWKIYYMEQKDLFLKKNIAYARMRLLQVQDDPKQWFTLRAESIQALQDLDVILMRKDPPFDMEYIYATYILEQAEAAGTLIVNKPQSLRDANEKLYALWFPECCPETLVTRDHTLFLDFLHTHHDIICKPLDSMGGHAIFRVRKNDANTNVIFETLSKKGTHYFMLQRFIPEITQGDKRVLMIDGNPIPYALARIPAAGEIRGNLAAGGTGKGIALSEHDQWICKQVGPTLRKKGLLFVGLDIIGNYLTEINVTSPTCIRELDKEFSLNISAQLMDAILKYRNTP